MPIACVVPSCRPDRLREFQAAWRDLFVRHDVTLIVVLDGPEPQVVVGSTDPVPAESLIDPAYHDVFCHQTDACRNYGFAIAARHPEFRYVLTLDDDVAPPPGKDPIAEHLSVLGRRVSATWMNTAPSPPWPYLRGVPYSVRREAQVVLSHGVWSNVPDFDAPTQLQLSAEGIPTDLPYYVGPIPRGVLFPLCGMNVMVDRRILPEFYFAPMGPKGYGFNRFADIWMGIAMKPHLDRFGWACYTGASKVVHTRASDVYKNLAQEAEGLRENEYAAYDIHYPIPRDGDREIHAYFPDYAAKRKRYAEYIIRQMMAHPEGT